MHAPLSRALLVLLAAGTLALSACQNRTEPEPDDTLILDDDIGAEATGGNVNAAGDTTGMGELLDVTPEEIGEGLEVRNTENARQQGVEPGQ